MSDSIFTKIIKGEIPCHKVYEDEKTFAFLDIGPLLPGHVLVVPKTQIDHIDDLPDDDYQALFTTVRKVAKRVKEVLGTQRAVIQVWGFDVPHAHVHVIPADSGKQFLQALADHIDAAKKFPYQPSAEELAALADKLAF